MPTDYILEGELVLKAFMLGAPIDAIAVLLEVENYEIEECLREAMKPKKKGK